MDDVSGRFFFARTINQASCSELRFTGNTGVGDDVPDVCHAGDVVHQTLEPEAESGMWHGAVPA